MRMKLAYWLYFLNNTITRLITGGVILKAVPIEVTQRTRGYTVQDDLWELGNMSHGFGSKNLGNIIDKLCKRQYSNAQQALDEVQNCNL